MNRHGSSFGSNNCSKRVVISVFINFFVVDLVGFSEVHPQGMRPFGECPNPLFLAPHPLFLGGKSSHFSTFFVFFYIDFVFFFMIFAYFPIILSNFLLAQTHIGRFREFAQGRTFRLTKGDLTGMSLILYCGHFCQSHFCHFQLLMSSA